ncbi:MAG: STAS domain-containing protein [Rhodospirillales bacterium]|nr:STAS domain-containing protein [Rhodospirillales bacterium]MCW8952371.1 STAS domain-containing protein [Rhodospirillales bacterium]
MNYDVKNLNNQKVISMNGRLTFNDHEVFREVVELIEGARGESCVLDLSPLEFIDSAGLGMLVLAGDAAKEAGASLTVKPGGGQVRQMLDIAKFDTLLNIV